jgi:hypothetical protein
MSHSDYDLHDKRYFETPVSCQNCNTTRGPIDTISTDDGETLRLCEDCCEETRRIEALADQLAGMPSCEIRQQLIEMAETVRGMVHGLRAHDMACSCSTVRKSAVAARREEEAA